MRSRRARKTSHRRLLLQLVELPSESGRSKYLRQHPQLLKTKVVERLCQKVLEEVRIDTRRALDTAEAAVAIGRALGDKQVLAFSLRAKANALYMAGQNRRAINFHERAIRIFQALGNEEEVARTLSTSLQSLILSGEYDRAFAAAGRARKIFARLGDERRLARLENNVGNIYHRQDRIAEALACYERVYQKLLPYGDSEDLAIALGNMAVCLISLNDFPRALATYEKARAFCDPNHMPLLRAQVDYNIAYLYYLRGEYSRAIERLHEARRQCEKSGDDYHLALCHLDLSEIYLELNLSEEAKEMAEEGYARFQKLRMGYEAAKALANQAIALSQEGKALASLDLFRRSREIFAREKNLVWPWLIDLYQALVLYNEGRLFESRRLCGRAAEFFRDSLLPGKAVLCELLLARLSARSGVLESARRDCRGALERLAVLEAPVLSHQANFLMGQIEEASGRFEAAEYFYKSARGALETLRSSLHGEELKIAFMKNRLEVYERLVELCLRRDGGQAAAEEAFGYIETAKSRSLLEMIFPTRSALPASEIGQSDFVRRIRDLREELNWYYHRIEQEQLRSEERSPERIVGLQKEARAKEKELLNVLREAPNPQWKRAMLEGPVGVPLERIRAVLAPETALVEYFAIGNRFVAALLTRRSLEILPITLVSRVTNLLRMLRFQFSKCRLGDDYLRTFGDSLFEASRGHLRELYQELVAPISARLRARHLVIVPHCVLHYAPFHAFYDGERYLIDSFSISYAPSASIYTLCCERTVPTEGNSLVLGIPDAQTPFILDEVNAVADLLPNSELHVGDKATVEVLKRRGPHARLLHIATHGNFRQDNPMFSGIRLGDSYLSLYDLYQLKLGSELVTLSGCATGLNVVAAGDELVGLIRGLLHAGARSLLLSLWDVHDRSTAEFMKRFYRLWRESEDKAKVLQETMMATRESCPHPYYWAPFMLIGSHFSR